MLYRASLLAMKFQGSKFYCVHLGPSSKDWERDSEGVHNPVKHTCSCGNRSFTQHRPSAFRQWPRGGRRISAELCCFYMICIFTSVNSFIDLSYLLFKCHAILTSISSSCIETHFISCYFSSTELCSNSFASESIATKLCINNQSHRECTHGCTQSLLACQLCMVAERSV